MKNVFYLEDLSVGQLFSTGSHMLDEAQIKAFAAQFDHLARNIGTQRAPVIVDVRSVVSDEPQSPAAYKARLGGLSGLSHVTVEVHHCRGA